MRWLNTVNEAWMINLESPMKETVSYFSPVGRPVLVKHHPCFRSAEKKPHLQNRQRWSRRAGRSYKLPWVAHQGTTESEGSGAGCCIASTKEVPSPFSVVPKI